MKMKTRYLLVALVLCFAMLMPTLAGCAEENATTTQDSLGDLSATTEEEVKLPSNYIPPENYMDFSNSESLNSTENSGKGSTITSATLQQKPAKVEDELGYAGTENDRREASLAKMRKMLTLKWTPSADITYSYNAGAYTSATEKNATAFNKNKITLQAGKVYSGIPYTLGSSEDAAFVAYATQTEGIYKVPLSEQLLSGKAPYSRLGTDGVDALFWAWASTGSTVNFTEIANMVKERGVLTVGGYEIPEDMFDAKGIFTGTTEGVVQHNGEEKMLKAYAALKKADALISDSEALERAAMIVSVNVKYLPDGSVDTDASTVTVLEQTPAALIAYEALSDTEKEAVAEEVLAIGGVDVVYTFSELLQNDMIPVTCADFLKEGNLPGHWSYEGLRVFDKSSIFEGTLQSSLRMAYVTMEVYDAEGERVLYAVAFPNESGVKEAFYQYDLSTIDDSTESSRRFGGVSTSSFVKKDTYRVVNKGMLSTGEVVTLREFEATW